MYVSRLSITNIRSIERLEIDFAPEERAGWHVVLGANGAGKSSVVRSLALALAGPREAVALRQNWNTWQRQNTDTNGTIDLTIVAGSQDAFGTRANPSSEVQVGVEFRRLESSMADGPQFEVVAIGDQPQAEQSLWGANAGWFSASFGPYRRFTGGDQAFDRLFQSNPRLAPHLSAFGEDVALTEGLRWLRDLRIRQLEARDSPDADSGEPGLLARLITFLNGSKLLPHGAQIKEVRSEEIVIHDADNARVAVEQMSDGYRTVLSMIFEILRQMTRAYGSPAMIDALDTQQGVVRLPGVVAIDEVDAHLHPSWQKDIGPWFTRCFPQIQFVVTTHSPIICRNATTVWRLANPGSDEPAGRVEGTALQRLIHGSILEAYGTEFFGRDVARSQDSKELLSELAALNRKALKAGLSGEDRRRMDELRSILPTRAADTSAA